MNNPHAAYVLSLDIGTSSVRAVVFDPNGYPLEGLVHQIHYTMEQTSDGGEWIDADRLCHLVFEVIDAVVEKINPRRLSIHAVANCTFMHNVLGVDADGKPCTPLLNWSDTRPEAVLQELQKSLDPTAYTERTGCPFHSSFLPAKLLWLRQAMNPAFEQTRFWMSFGEYLLFNITGERKCSYSMASASGLLDSRRCVWDPTTLNTLPVQADQLSELCDKHESYRTVQPEYASRWTCLAQARWFPSLGDGICNNVGAGCVDPNRMTLMAGTSGAMRVGWKGNYQQPPNGLWCYRLDQYRPMQGGALSNGGNLFAWMRQTLNLPAESELEDCLRRLLPDAHGLTVLPFLHGQRAPRWNPDSRAMIYGLRASTRPEQILQAGLEAVAMRFRLIHSLLKPVAAADHILVASGGGLLKSPAWIQIMADVLAKPIRVSQVKEASCRGAALCALESMAILEDAAHADPCLGETVTPRLEFQETYNRAFDRHIDIETAVQGSAAFSTGLIEP